MQLYIHIYTIRYVSKLQVMLRSLIKSEKKTFVEMSEPKSVFHRSHRRRFEQSILSFHVVCIKKWEREKSFPTAVSWLNFFFATELKLWSLFTYYLPIYLYIHVYLRHKIIMFKLLRILVSDTIHCVNLAKKALGNKYALKPGHIFGRVAIFFWCLNFTKNVLIDSNIRNLSNECFFTFSSIYILEIIFDSEVFFSPVWLPGV